VNATRNSAGPVNGANPKWLDLQIGWSDADDHFVADILQRDRTARGPLALNPIEFTWLAALPAAGVVNGLTRALSFTPDVKHK